MLIGVALQRYLRLLGDGLRRHLSSLQFLQLLVQLSGFLQLSSEITAAEFKSPIQTNGKGAESDDNERLKEIPPR